MDGCRGRRSWRATGAARAARWALLVGIVASCGTASAEPSVLGATSAPEAAEPTVASMPPVASPPPEPTAPVLAPFLVPIPAPAARHEPGSAVVGGRERTWQVFVPAGGSVGRPLLVVLHGRDGTGRAMRSVGLEPLASRDDVVVAYADAVDGSWNDGRRNVDSQAHQQGVDDVAFLRALVGDVAARYGIDLRRVAVAGFSNGAMMANRLACDAADVFGVVVQVAGAAADDQLDRCHPARAVALQLVASVGDPTVPFAGGPIGSAGGKRRGSAAAATTVAAWWAAAAGCPSSSVSPVAGTAPSVQRWAATGCPPGREVVLDELAVADHAWFEQGGYSATATAWAFLGRHGVGAE